MDPEVLNYLATEVWSDPNPLTIEQLEDIHNWAGSFGNILCGNYLPKDENAWIDHIEAAYTSIYTLMNCIQWYAKKDRNAG